jgi:ATP-binding cassette subfamily B protein/ATP-binding cassette subfamily C protein
MTLLISHQRAQRRPHHRPRSGKVLERGDHEHLLAQGGRYAQLFDLQARGYR